MFISFFVGRIFVVFYFLKNLRKRKKKKWCFVERRVKETTLEHPSFSLSLCISFPQQQFRARAISTFTLLLKVKQQ
jgi:hypothetical protein